MDHVLVWCSRCLSCGSSAVLPLAMYMGGYLIEKSLSVDNVFVWAVLFAHFQVPKMYQHRVLFWGIFGALAMRIGFIFAGVAIINAFKVTLIIFGLFLLYSGIKLLQTHDEGFDPSQSKSMKLFHRFVPSTDELDGQKLFTVKKWEASCNSLVGCACARGNYRRHFCHRLGSCSSCGH